MQSKDEIEFAYREPDPWKYKENPDDIERKRKIVDFLRDIGPFARALDIGCGEGWVTIELPAGELHGFEISENAKKRFPFGVTPVDYPEGLYDLVVSTGTMYPHYDWKLFAHHIRQASTKIVLLSNIEPWIVDDLRKFEGYFEFMRGKMIHEERFKYRDWNQLMQVFDVSKKG